MCGFVGLVLFGDATFAPLPVAERMAANIRHRGPDDFGTWQHPQGRAAMAFQRLAIVDLSQHGHQPMASASGRFVITFNGEIYNFRELRQELAAAGCAFRGGSDTEVILAGFETWGLLPTIQRLVGMFAIAVHDLREGEFTLVRDRFGVKPLYYGCPDDDAGVGRGDGNGRFARPLYYGSELKGLRGAWDRAPRIHRGALQQLLRYQYVPAPWTPWQGIRKLLPGHLLTIRLRDGAAQLRAYWSPGAALRAGARDPLRDDVPTIAAELERQVERAVRERLVADVPLGAFLSGGIDSSIVVAAMQRVSSTKTKTFTIGSHDPDIDEADAAARIAAHLGTEHQALRVGLDEARPVIERLGELADEPCGDASFVPTYLVSQFARREVTVVLSGDGGDEVFAGYPQHAFAPRAWPWQRRLPAMVGKALRGALLDGHHGALRPTLAKALAVLPKVGRPHTQQRLAKALRTCGLSDRATFAAAWRQLVARPEAFLAEPVADEAPLFAPDVPLHELGDVRAECWADLVGYMPDDVLAKVDRASMAVSLEAREPLLDHRLFEFAARIPESMLVRDGRGKWILRQALYRSVPQQLVDGPKKGFALPVAGWVVGPLRDWAESLLDERTLREQGFFDATAVRAAWQNLREPGSSPVRLPFFALWSILSFQAWLARWN
jgi:asparagine synthase (glutamine-hydrolysing)